MRPGVAAAILLMIGAGTLAAARAPVRAPAPARAAPAADWAKAARLSPDGTVVIGNPAAPIRLTEYLSFSCPHCAEFARASEPVLIGQMVRSGKVRIEYRPLIADSVALGATIVAQCAAPARYAEAARAIFTRQDVWVPLAANFFNREARRFAAEKPIERVRIAAQSAGLYDIARETGLSDARLAACFADGRGVARLVANADQALKVAKVTPTFTIDGRDTGAHDWASLEPILRARGAR